MFAPLLGYCGKITSTNKCVCSLVHRRGREVQQGDHPHDMPSGPPGVARTPPVRRASRPRWAESARRPHTPRRNLPGPAPRLRSGPTRLPISYHSLIPSLHSPNLVITYTLVGKRNVWRENLTNLWVFLRPQQVFSLCWPTYIKFLFPSSSPNINYAKFVHIQDHTLDKLEQLQLRLAVVCY